MNQARIAPIMDIDETDAAGLFSKRSRFLRKDIFFFFKERRASHAGRMYENCIRQVSGQPQ